MIGPACCYSFIDHVHLEVVQVYLYFVVLEMWSNGGVLLFLIRWRRTSNLTSASHSCWKSQPSISLLLRYPGIFFPPMFYNLSFGLPGVNGHHGLHLGCQRYDLSAGCVPVTESIGVLMIKHNTVSI